MDLSIFTKDEIQYMMECVIFSSCTDSCWDYIDSKRDVAKSIMDKFAQLNYKTGKDLYIQNGISDDEAMRNYILERNLSHIK